MRTATLVFAGAVAVAGCASDAKTCKPNAAGYAPDVTVERFPNPTTIDNRFYPLVPGAVFKYRDPDNVVTTTTVTADTKTVMGIEVRVVHDVATSATGEILEDTLDYYAQDRDGTVWYMGEDTK